MKSLGGSTLVVESGDVATLTYGCGRRHLIVALGFMAFACVYAQRWNFSIGIISMVNHTAVKQLHHQRTLESNSSLRASANRSISECIVVTSTNLSLMSARSDGPHVWDEVQQGVALGSFFYGYVVTQVLGGWMSSKISAKWTVGISVLGSSLFTLLTPVAADFGLTWLVVDRIIIGLCQGLIFPAFQQLLGKWTPPDETTKATGTSQAGTTVGTVLTFPFVGLLAESKSFGWQSSFYIIGAVGLLWFVLWTFLAFESPHIHPAISAAERNYILQSIHRAKIAPSKQIRGKLTVESTKPHQIPWRQIVTSVPVWAIFISHMSTNFGFYMLLTKIPSYLKAVLGNI